MTWLEDLFFLTAFVVAVALVTFSVYDGNTAPKPSPQNIVATSSNREREMPVVSVESAGRVAEVVRLDATRRR